MQFTHILLLVTSRILSVSAATLRPGLTGTSLNSGSGSTQGRSDGSSTPAFPGSGSSGSSQGSSDSSSTPAVPGLGSSGSLPHVPGRTQVCSLPNATSRSHADEVISRNKLSRPASRLVRLLVAHEAYCTCTWPRRTRPRTQKTRTSWVE